MMLIRVLLCGLICLVPMNASVIAEEEAAAPGPEKPGTPLEIAIVMTRAQDGRVVARLPYTLLVNADDRATRVYAGIQLPIVVRHEGANTVMFKNAGGTIRCEATALADGRFKLSLYTELGSVYAANGEAETTQAGAEAATAPVLRSFTTEANVTLRDGQTVRLSDSADPITGETVKTEVSLRRVK